MFAILGALLFVLAFLRARHNRHDFADRPKETRDIDQGIRTVGQDGSRIYGRPFVTAGWIVLQVTFLVAAVEVVLLVLVARHEFMKGLLFFQSSPQPSESEARHLVCDSKGHAVWSDRDLLTQYFTVTRGPPGIDPLALKRKKDHLILTAKVCCKLSLVVQPRFFGVADLWNIRPHGPTELWFMLASAALLYRSPTLSREVGPRTSKHCTSRKYCLCGSYFSNC